MLLVPGYVAATVSLPLGDASADQLRALAAIKRDMEASRPMDRLICGDVGFGKTEVALRAAFATAMTGRQVAIVAPTTLLARQHYDQFVERLQGFPIDVGRLFDSVPDGDAALALAGTGFKNGARLAKEASVFVAFDSSPSGTKPRLRM